jgi:drug/metabolite transporter (DMT)-like permease
LIVGILAAIGFAGGVLVDKYELSKRRIPVRTYVPLMFLTLCLFTGIALVIFQQPIMQYGTSLNFSYVFAFLAMILVALAWNLFYYRALMKESLQEFDLILLTEPLITIAMAGLLFRSERNATVLLLALIASITLVIAHMRRKKIKFDHYAKELILAIFLMSLEVMIIRYLLEVFSPIGLYFLRTFVVYLLVTAIYKPNYKTVKHADAAAIALTAGFGVMQMVLRYYGYEMGGVVITTLMLLLGPLIVEMVSVSLLKEKVNIKTVSAFIVIAACVLFASVLGT